MEDTSTFFKLFDLLIIDSYRGVPIPDGNRVDRGWFADAAVTDILAPEVGENTVIRNELYIVDHSETEDEKVIIEHLDEHKNILASSVYKITAQNQIIIDEYIVTKKKKLPATIRITLEKENPSLIFIKEPVVHAIRNPNLKKTTPHVILISLDTLRADRLGCYGYSRDTSPNIDAFAAESFVFTNAYSNSNWTLPAHTSMFTSLYPTEHRNTGTQSFDEAEHYYITEAFNNLNYLTIAFTGGGFVDAKYGFNKKMDYHIEDVTNFDEKALHMLNHLLDSNKNFPVFLFFHTYEIHDYHKEKPSYNKYIHKKFFQNGIGIASYIVFWAQYVWDDPKFAKIRKKELTEEKLQYTRDLYDGAISYTDGQMGIVFDTLKEMDMYDSAWIILTSDHGEGLGEIHNNDRSMSWTHAYRLYNNQIKVPLIIKPPKHFMQKMSTGYHIEPLAQTIDVPPTISSILNVPLHEQFQGKSLYPFFVSSEIPLENVVFSENLNKARFSIITRNEKLIMAAHSNNPLFPNKYTYQLYQLKNDPNEKVNLLKTEHRAKTVPMYNELKQLLWEHIGDLFSASDTNTFSSKPTVPELQEGEIDPNHLQRLKDLGYL